MTDEELQSYLVTGPCKVSYKPVREKLDGNIVEQFKWAKHGALLEIPDAIHDVVSAYQAGHGVESNRVAAFEWQRKAAENSDEGFYFDLAMAYYDGDGTDVNPDKFWEWMRAAVKVKDKAPLEAMYKLADAHRNPIFGTVSEEDAFGWIEKAAITGAPTALMEVAQAYKNGRGVIKNLNLFLEGAGKAVEAARVAIPPRKSSPSTEDWNDQDYPEALWILADAYSLTGDTTKAKCKAKDAALAAEEAIDRAKEDGKKLSGQRLPEIMADHLRNYLEPDGTVASDNQSEHFQWLQKIDAAIDQTVPGKDDQAKLPPKLANVIFALGRVHA